MSQKIALATWAWETPAYTSKLSNSTNPYGEVYFRVLRGLKESGWEIVSLWDHKINSSKLDAERLSSYLRYWVRSAQRIDPDLVIHDDFSFRAHLLSKFEERYSSEEAKRNAREIADIALRLIYTSFPGKAERVWSPSYGEWEGEISSKNKFYYAARRLQIPVPETIIVNSLEKLDTSYTDLALRLSKREVHPLLFKRVNSAGGEGVFKVENQKDLDDIKRSFANSVNDPFVIQRKLPLPANLPYSIRVVCWGDALIGATLLMNPRHNYCSNSHQGGAVNLDLSLPGKNPRRERSSFLQMDAKLRTRVEATARWCGIDPYNRVLPEEVAYYSRTIGLMESNALLKGLDFMYDEKGKPVGIEANMHPGPPGTGMFSDITSLQKVSEKREIRLAAGYILEAIFNN